MRYLAELYVPATTAVTEVASKARAGAEQAQAAGAQIRFLQIIFVPQDETCFVIYQAHSPDQVSVAGTLTGLVFDRIVPAICDDAPDG